MKTRYTAWVAVGASLLVAACGGGGSDSATGTQNSNPSPGQLAQSPPLRVTSLTSADYTAKLNATSDGQGLLTLSTGSPTGSVKCGVDVNYVKYGSVDGNGNNVVASAALMVPTGCTGPFPIVVHAHGTNIEKRYNLADFADSGNPAYKEAQTLASIYAANGYIVVAPNYVGYDASSASYHPFLVADQQSKDMYYALLAANSALPTLIANTATNGKVFVSGYSQGGHVALATQKFLKTDSTAVAKLASLNLALKAAAPMSGPYALQSFADQIVGGAVDAGSTRFMPMLVTAYQKKYTGINSSTSSVYSSAYANGIESYFPGPLSYDAVATNNVVPDAALFNSAPTSPTLQALSPPSGGTATQTLLWTGGFGSPFLVTDTYRLQYLGDAAANPASGATTPTNALRVALKANDLSKTVPTPLGATLLCGGGGDPVVYYSTNTTALKTTWTTNAAAATAAAVTEVNMDNNAGGTAGLFSALQTSFTAKYSGTTSTTFTDAYTAAIAAGQSASDAQKTAFKALLAAYHTALVPYCVRAAASYFANPAF